MGFNNGGPGTVVGAAHTVSLSNSKELVACGTINILDIVFHQKGRQRQRGSDGCQLTHTFHLNGISGHGCGCERVWEFAGFLVNFLFVSIAGQNSAFVAMHETSQAELTTKLIDIKKALD